MGKNLLVFHLEVDFGDDIRVVANNEKDLESFLIDKSFKAISFLDIDRDYGTCHLSDQYGRQTAKCFYVEYI